MADFRSKRLKRIKLQAFLACFLSLGTVAAAGSATFAWFSTNKTATASYTNIVAKDSSLVKSVKYYPISSISDDGNSYTFSTSSSSASSINEYSRIDGNAMHQLLIEITLNDDESYRSSFNVIATADEDVLNGQESWAGYKGWDTATTYPLSTIISFYYTETVTPGSNTITVTKDTSETSSDVTQHFIGISADTGNPKFTQTLTLKENSTKEDKVYIMLDYYLDAIDSIYSFNIGNTKFSSNESLKFGCDFHINLKKVS